MGAAHKQGARIGDRRASRFRNETGVGAGQDRFQQLVDFARRRVDVEFADLDFLDRPFGSDLLQEGARGFRVFANVVLQRRGAGSHGFGKDIGERGAVAVAERVRDQVQNAAHAAPISGNPAARNMRDNAISGKPTSAVGSSEWIASTSVMPKPSDFALPATS